MTDDRRGAGAGPRANALVTRQLREPRMQFDYDNRHAVQSNPFVGLGKFGPYDASERRRAGITPTRIVVVAQKEHRGAISNLIEGLRTIRLKELQAVFPLEFVDQVLVPRTRVADEAAAYQRAIEEWFAATPYQRGVDLAIVLHSAEPTYRGASPYFSSKAAFMRRGVPTQSICVANVANQNLERFKSYYVANILTACYAKTGGVPWVVQPGARGRPEVTVGVATTSVADGRGVVQRYVGISTIFRENGAFALWDITEPEQDLEKYEAQLETTIVRAIRTFEQREGKRVTRIACHVSGKRAGFRETDAVRRAVEQFPGRSIAADIVHVSENAPLWLLDGSGPGLRPKSGLLTHLTLDGKSALMHTEGHSDAPGQARSLTRPLRLNLHSPLPESGCEEIHQHLYDLRWMSWRGVRAASGPVSVAYPKKMAFLLAYMHEQADVAALDILSQLKNKAWFL